VLHVGSSEIRGAPCCRVDSGGRGAVGRLWAWHSVSFSLCKVTHIYSYVGLVSRVDLRDFTLLLTRIR